RGDPTARLLGRISLNPIRHIDPIGTLLLPAVALFFHVPVLGWAKPTPVDPRNFKNPVWDDIKTSVVGPISNFVVAGVAVIVLVVIALSSNTGRELVDWMARYYGPDRMPEGSSILVPLVVFFYQLMQ